MKGRRFVFLASALALAALAAFAPAAAAQFPPDVALELAAPQEPIPPDVGDAPLGVRVTVACTHLVATAARSDPMATVEWSLSEGVVVSGPESILFDPQRCAGGTAMALTEEDVFRVAVSRSTPGLQALPATAAAIVGDASSKPSVLTVTADYSSVSQVKTAAKLKACSPCDAVPFELEVTNLGNARTQYTFESALEPSSGWSLALPGVLLLDAGATGKATVTASGSGGEAAFQVVVRPAAADDPSKTGNPLTVHLLVRDGSLISRATPGPGALLAGLAFLGAATALRARRRA